MLIYIYEQAKREAWKNLTKNIIIKKNSRKAWDLIKKVNSTGPPPRHPNPLTKANELANDFANRSKSSNLSPITL